MDLSCLAPYRVNRTQRTFLKNILGLWKTTMEVNSKQFTQVTINYNIYQGDALSLLLFYIGLNLLSQIITRTGLTFKSTTTVSHLLCMEDIKLYAKNNQDINSLIYLIYTEDIRIGEMWLDGN